MALGVTAGLGVRWAARRSQMEPGPDLVLTLLLAVATLGVARVAGTGGVLAVFTAGPAYNTTVDAEQRRRQDGVDEAVNRYAVLPLFAVLGAVLPWSGWAQLGPGAAPFATVVLLLRRPPVVVPSVGRCGLVGATRCLWAGSDASA